MKRPRFRQPGFSRSRTTLAAVMILLAAAISVWIFVVVDRRSHSASDTLLGVVPLVVPIWILILIGWAVSRTVEPRGPRRSG